MANLFGLLFIGISIVMAAVTVTYFKATWNMHSMRKSGMDWGCLFKCDGMVDLDDGSIVPETKKTKNYYRMLVD